MVPIASVPSTVGPSHGAVTVYFSLPVVSFVDAAVGKDALTSTVALATLGAPTTRVLASVSVYHLTVRHGIIIVRAAKGATVGILEDTTSVLSIVFPSTTIPIATTILKSTFTVPTTQAPISFVKAIVFAVVAARAIVVVVVFDATMTMGDTVTDSDESRILARFSVRISNGDPHDFAGIMIYDSMIIIIFVIIIIDNVANSGTGALHVFV